ncbi:MAG: hypothetical protein NC408_09685 [Candidatus Gastranaerophilales bacterium]|nr:hypothetical protein [Candidatus Gastranaerophilales bacterium]MCM1073782.1 hypothetical protein [Bacteroides sp.]
MQVQFIVYIITLIIVTALVCGMNPQMHKRVVISDYKYKVVDIVQPVIQKQEIIPQSNPVIQEDIKLIPQTQNTSIQVSPAQSVKVQQVKTKTAQQSVTLKPKSQPVVKPESVKQPEQPEKKVEAPKVKQQLPAVQPKVVLTPQQETILWNKWRSDLQNKIMDTAAMPILPQGTVFRFTFSVSKDGKITNIKSWAENPKFTPYAIQYITPAIRNLQGKSILNFPEGSNRERVIFEGNMKISNTSKYSSSKDYNDVEKISY